eukprot:XP_001694266.1 predicted protein [Chlamydomonas reinhardtii]
MATPSGSLEQRYDIAETVDYILEGGFRDVALQFPDEQLADSPDVFALLQARLGDRARVHYGRASLSPVNSLPAFFVFPKEQLDAAAAAAALQPAIAAAEAERRQAGATAGATAGAAAGATAGGFQAVVVLVDQGYHHRLGEHSGHGRLPGCDQRAAAAVDVFVMVADAQGLILDSRDYLAPLVTPWEAALALTGRHIEADDYRLELGDDFERQHAERTRQQEAGQALVSLGGLGLDLASAEPKAVELAVEGRSGRAAGYADEQPAERSAAAW